MAGYPQPPYGNFPYPQAHVQMPPGLTSQGQAAAEGEHAQYPYNALMSLEQEARQQAINTGYQYNGGLPGLHAQPLTQNVPPSFPQFWQQPPPPLPQGTYSSPSFPASAFHHSPFPMPPPPPQPPSPALFAALAQQHNAQNVQNAPVTAIPASLPPQTVQPSQALQPPQAPQPKSLVAKRTRFTELSESDKEDGEVSEVDQSSPAHAGKQANPSSQSTAPRSIPQGPRSSRPANGSHLSQTTAPPMWSGSRNTPVVTEQSIQQAIRRDTPDDAKAFLKAVHQAGYTFDQLVRLGNLSAAPLRKYYRELGLPSSPDSPPKAILSRIAPQSVPLTHPLPKKPSQVAPAPATLDDKSAPAHPATTVKTDAMQAPPVDRKDYIARLQAVKNKQAAAAKATSTQEVPEAGVLQKTVDGPENGANSHTVQQEPHKLEQSSEELRAQQKTRQTEVLKQRLEAMKRKSKQPESPAPKSNDSSLQMRVPSSSGIPGLFMSSSAVSLAQPIQIAAATSRDASKTPLTRNQVSTPLTSDQPADELPNNAHGTVIDASDDESNGSAMDLDEDQSSTQHNGSLQINRAPQNEQRFAPPLDDFSRSVSTRPVGFATEPPSAVQSPGSAVANEQLAQKERDIAIMKMKLQEMELKKRKAKEAIARARTNDGSTPKPPQTIPLKRTIPSSTLPESASNGYERKTVTPRSSSVSDLAEQNSSSEWRKRRRAEIESGLPTLEAGIATNNARKAQLLKELEELEAQNRRVLQDKENLVQELERLGIDTEGASHAELQAKKDEIDLQKDLETKMTQNTSVVSAIPSPSMASNEPRESNSSSIATRSQLPGLMALRPVADMRSEDSRIRSPSAYKDIYSPGPRIEQGSMRSTADDSGSNGVEQNQGSSHLTLLRNSGSHNPTPAPVQDSVAEPPRVASSQTPASLEDNVDFHSLGSAASVESATGRLQDQTATQENDQKEGGLSPTGDRGMGMSQSINQDDSEYEPEEPTIDISTPLETPAFSRVTTVDEEEEYEPEEQTAGLLISPAALVSSPSMSEMSESSEDAGEIYEPPGADVPLVDTSLGATNQPVTVEPEAEAGMTDDDDPAAMDISSSSGDSDTDTSSDSDSDLDEQSSSKPFHQTHSLSISTHPADVTFPVADDLAPELHDAKPNAPQASANTDASIGFTPYRSPLQIFKSYRYSPRFMQEVAGGYQSLTYSHNIDANIPLCQWEGAGGQCVDPACPGQHFRDMGISGDRILVQLGTANPGKTPEEKKEWNDGLRLVLRDLRQRNIKDPNGIAQEIAKFRREFLKDDTRVVNL